MSAVPTADVQVRPARAGDAARCGEVQSRAWRSAYDGLLAPEVLEALEPDALAATWRDAVVAPPSERHHVLVATEGARVVGLAAAGPSPDEDAGPGDADLPALVVDPDHQRHGHASRLLNVVADLLREDGFVRLTTWVPAQDQPRRDFLEAAGLAADGAHRELVAGPDGQSVREVRLAAALAAR